jgi:competence protein ComGF
LAGFRAFTAFAALVALAALDGAAFVAVAAEEALSDAVLRRAGRADPEDVTMGFLREARVC